MLSPNENHHAIYLSSGTCVGNKLRVSGNLNKSAEPMYMHNEMITQGGISRCKVMYAVCSL